jgi:hypothetical protein
MRRCRSWKRGSLQQVTPGKRNEAIPDWSFRIADDIARTRIETDSLRVHEGGLSSWS